MVGPCSAPRGAGRVSRTERDARDTSVPRGCAGGSCLLGDPRRGAAPVSRHPALSGGAAAVTPLVPAPAVPEHDEVLPAPEGETAVAMGLVERAQAGDAEA